MNRIALSDIDRQISQLEKQLSALYNKRVQALDAEIKRSQTRIKAFNGSVSPGAEVPLAKSSSFQPVKKTGRPSGKRQPTKAKATAQPAALLPPPAAEAKATPAKPIQAFAKGQRVTQSVELTPAAAPARKVAALTPRQPKKRTRTPTAVVEKRIFDALKEAGLFGLSQVEVSKKTGLGYQTVVKKLKELPQVVKKGSGKDGRFYSPVL